VSAPRLAPALPSGPLPKASGLLARLLHALDQPLTGLQCSLELAVAVPRRPEEYLRALRESLELTSRMRILVEAIHELADLQDEDRKDGKTFLLDALLRETAADLLPVAEQRKVRLLVTADVPLPVQAQRSQLAALMFRILDSALSLAREGSELCIAARPEGEQAIVAVSWKPGPAPEYSPFSRPELGLLIAQAGWERVGREWTSTETANTRTCTIRVRLDSPAPQAECADPKNLK
jgi:hypothetical protein